MFADFLVGYEMLARRSGDLILLVHSNNGGVLDEDWNKWEVALRRFPPGTARFLVDAGRGDPPSARQRKLIRDYMLGTKTAVITKNLVQRAAITAFSWFAPDIAPFANGDVGAALAWLAVDADENEVRDEIRAARERLAAVTKRAAGR